MPYTIRLYYKHIGTNNNILIGKYINNISDKTELAQIKSIFFKEGHIRCTSLGIDDFGGHYPIEDTYEFLNADYNKNFYKKKYILIQDKFYSVDDEIICWIKVSKK
jgi:hypothetical protein